MHFSRLSYNAFLLVVDKLIHTAIDSPLIIAATSKFGYDESRLMHGEELYRDVSFVVQEQSRSIQEKIASHAQRRQLHLAVRKQYMKILQIARIAFDKDFLIRKALQLDGPREKNIEAWISQVALFGNRLLMESRWADEIKKYGVDRQDIKSMLNLLEQLTQVVHTCIKAKNEAKALTLLKKKKIKELQDWVSDYLKIAKIALEDNPELYIQLRVDQP